MGFCSKKSEQSGLVPGLKIEVVTEKKSVDSGDLQIEKVIFIASLTTEDRSAARKLQQTTTITTETDYQSEVDVTTRKTFENLKVKVTDSNTGDITITDTTTEDGVTTVIETENDVVVSCTRGGRTAPTCKALDEPDGDVPNGDKPGGDTAAASDRIAAACHHRGRRHRHRHRDSHGPRDPRRHPDRHRDQDSHQRWRDDQERGKDREDRGRCRRRRHQQTFGPLGSAAAAAAAEATAAGRG